MNLIKFLTVGSIFSVILGEFGQYPFGTTSLSVSLTDVLLLLTIALFLIWQIGIKKSLKIPAQFYLIVAFWMVGFLSLLLSDNLRGVLYLIRFILYSCSFLIAYCIVKENRNNLDVQVKAIIASGFLITVLGVLQLVILPDLQLLTGFGYDPHKNRLVSTFLDPNFAGEYLNIIFIICLGLFCRFRKRIWLIACGLLFVSIILTFSRSALLALLIPVVLFGLFMQKRLLAVLAAVLIILYLFVPRINERVNGVFSLDVTAKERIESWKKGIEVFTKSPIFGVGFNNLRDTYIKNNSLKVFSEDGGHSGAGADSSLIFVLATTGFVGGLIYFSFWVKVVIDSIRKMKPKENTLALVVLCLVISLLIDSQFINSLFFPPIMLIYFVLLGGIYGYEDY